MKRLAQEARIRQGVVHYAEKYGKSAAARQYGVSLSSVKRWSKRVRWYMEVTARAFTPTKQASQNSIPQWRKQLYSRHLSKRMPDMAGT